MSIVLDERIRSACEHSRCRCHDDRLRLEVERLHGRAGALAGYPEILRVTWMSRDSRQDKLVAWRVGDVTVYVDTRVARYASTCDIMISAWRMGPICGPVVDPAVIHAMRTWERTHPEPEGRQARDGRR